MGMKVTGVFTKGGGGGSAEINVAAGPLLPAIAPDRQIFVLSTEPVAAWYVSTNEPTAPAEGDVWVKLAEGQHILSLSDASPFFTIGLFQALRYDGTQWQAKDGYLGAGGAWQQFAWPFPSPGTPLEEWTWDEISGVSALGHAPTFLQIGDTKTFISGGVTYTAEIVDFDHDDLADGSGKAGITLGMRSCFSTVRRMNATNTTAGGWGGSEFYKTTLPTIKGALPEDLQTVVRHVRKLTSAGSQSANIVTTEDDFFLFSEIEIFGSTNYSKLGEGSQYPLFATASSRVKRLGPSGSATEWWQRSPYTSDSVRFCTVGAGGGFSYYGASGNAGVALGFCV